MAREGIDFFPLDVSLDTKFELIEAEYGLTGFGVIVHLLQEIYGKAGYYLEWTNEVALLFARKIGLGGSVVSEIVEAAIRRGMFDKEIFDKYHILTSRGIQRRYFEAVSRRKLLKVDKNILLVDVAQISKSADILDVSVNISEKNVDRTRQSKVKESKVKYSIGGEDGGDRGSGGKNQTAESPTATAAKDALVVDEYRRRIGALSATAADELTAFARQMTAAVCFRAMDEAVDCGKAMWPYVRAILQDKLQRGVRTLADWDGLLAAKSGGTGNGCKGADPPKRRELSPIERASIQRVLEQEGGAAVGE